MQSDFLKNTDAEASWLVKHPHSQEDSIAATALRSFVAPMKGKFEGTAGRGPFNGIMERVAVPVSVTFEAATAAIIHVHGSCFNWGTAQCGAT
jgi:hypothetical protein